MQIMQIKLTQTIYCYAMKRCSPLPHLMSSIMIKVLVRNVTESLKFVDYDGFFLKKAYPFVIVITPTYKLWPSEILI